MRAYEHARAQCTWSNEPASQLLEFQYEFYLNDQEFATSLEAHYDRPLPPTSPPTHTRARQPAKALRTRRATAEGV